MKNLIKTMSIIFALSLGNFVQANAISSILIDDDRLESWQILGIKKVNYGLDRDEINVTHRDGFFSKVKIKVRHAPMNLHRMVIHFGNGSTQNVAIKKNFNKGGVSRTIDLEGGKRVIKKVVLWYDTKNMASRKAKLELWGKH